MQVICKSINLISMPGEKFTRFDYGPNENLERYGTVEAPEYSLKRITVPVYIFWAQNDPISPPEVHFINTISFWN
jgi:pimeloyl-ACP methyl ester carboxylesterase